MKLMTHRGPEAESGDTAAPWRAESLQRGESGAGVDMVAPGARRLTARRVRCALLVSALAYYGVVAAGVPMRTGRDAGDGDYQDDQQVPPTHYGRATDLTKPPRPRAVGRGAQTEWEPKTGGESSGQEGGGSRSGNGTKGWSVALNTLLMALASGLGAAPFFVVEKVPRKWLGVANALASGVMIAASFGLIKEGLDSVNHVPHTLVRLVGGMILGLVFIIFSQQLVDGHEVEMGSLKGLDARKAIMVMGIMTLHSFSEGLGVGVSYGGEHGHRQGMVTTWAIALHNIPEGLAVALVAVPRGESKWTAAAWAVISSLPQPLVAIPAYIFVEWFSTLLPIGLGCAAGTMIWMVFAELVPDALKTTDAHTIATTLSLALTSQLALQSFIEMRS